MNKNVFVENSEKFSLTNRFYRVTMLRQLTEKYRHSGYDCRITVNSQGKRCINKRQSPNCPGWQPYITITTRSLIAYDNGRYHREKLEPSILTDLSVTIIADCDECRRVSDNPYVKSSTDLEAVLKIKVAGMGELCRRERQSDYFEFKELRYISCEKCNVTWHMSRTVYSEQLDGDHDRSMNRRSGKKAMEIQRLMEADDNCCRDNHITLMATLDKGLSEFSAVINRVEIPNKTAPWQLYNCVDSYLSWRFPRDGYICGREQLALIFLAYDYDAGALFYRLPKEILRMILTC